MNKPQPKFFANPARKQPAKPYQPYTPEWQQRGLDPNEGDGVHTLPQPKQVSILHSRREAQSAQTFVPPNVPYADVPALTPAAHLNIPNSGNNFEQMWHGPLVSEDEFIDNNEFVDVEGLQGETGQFLDAEPFVDTEPFQGRVAAPPEPARPSVEAGNGDIPVGGYAIVLDSNVVATGSHSEMEQVVSAMIFGEYNGIKIPPEQIIVLQRKAIKAGVFID
jgi:hypothetical protein